MEWGEPPAQGRGRRDGEQCMTVLTETEGKQVLEQIVSRNKTKVALSKCPLFNASVLEISARDRRILEMLHTFNLAIHEKVDGAVHRLDEPQLLTYLRGVRCAHGLLLQYHRKAVYELFGQAAINVFDEYYKIFNLVGSDNEEEDLWHRFYAYLNQHIEEALSDYVYEEILKKFFFALVGEIRKAQVYHALFSDKASLTELPSVPFQFKRVFNQPALFELFNPDYVPDSEDVGEDIKNEGGDYTLADYVEEREQLLSQFAKKDIRLAFLKEFLCRAAALDNPKGDVSVTQKLARAMELLSSVKRSESKALGTLWWSKKASDKGMEPAKEYEELHTEIVWFVHGCFQALSVILLGDIRKTAGKLKASQAFYDIILDRQVGALPLKRFFKCLILNRFREFAERPFLQLVRDLMQEAVIKDFNKECYRIEVTKGKVFFSVDLWIKKHEKFAKLVEALTRMSPELEPEIVACPSVMVPLIGAGGPPEQDKSFTGQADCARQELRAVFGGDDPHRLSVAFPACRQQGLFQFGLCQQK